MRFLLAVLSLFCTILPPEIAEKDVFSSEISIVAQIDDPIEEEDCTFVRSARPTFKKIFFKRTTPESSFQRVSSFQRIFIPTRPLTHFDKYIFVIRSLRL